MSTVSDGIRQYNDGILLGVKYLESPQFSQRCWQRTQSVLSQFEGLESGKVECLWRDVVQVFV